MSFAFFPLDFSLSPFERARLYITWAEQNREPEVFDRVVTEKLRLVSVAVRDEASRDKTQPLSTAVFELLIEQRHCSPWGTLQGATVPLIFDVATSSAVNAAARPGFWDNGHASRILNCSFLRPVKAGDTIRIEVEVTALGKRSGMTRGLIRKRDSGGELGEVCYTCEHDRVCFPSPREKL